MVYFFADFLAGCAILSRRTQDFLQQAYGLQVMLLAYHFLFAQQQDTKTTQQCVQGIPGLGFVIHFNEHDAAIQVEQQVCFIDLGEQWHGLFVFFFSTIKCCQVVVAVGFPAFGFEQGARVLCKAKKLLAL